MPLRDMLKKKDKVPDGVKNIPPPPPIPDEPEFQFTFMRSDTHTQEIISPPTFSDSSHPPTSDGKNDSRLSGLFKGRSRTVSNASAVSVSSRNSEKHKEQGGHRRISQRLHLRKSDVGSNNVPVDLPEITVGDDTTDVTGIESQWEARATILAKKNEQQRSRPSTPIGSVTDLGTFSDLTMGAEGRRSVSSGRDKGVVSSQYVDDNIQEAIRLHEAGELTTATQMFGRLADPKGENNALSQVLYGLALRHGWGCTPNQAEAVVYLSAAASNAASIEELALKAGMKKGGAAKGELVLAIFELANCFRHGWGVAIDKFAAKQVRLLEGLDRGEAWKFLTDFGGQYYETAANLGDTDAMNEVAWCYLEGFGCKKDKFAAAKYYRLAENGGNKTLGNTWIWKEKYNDPKK